MMKKKKEELVAYTLADKITQLRHTMKLTQKDMANQLHVDRSTYSYYEIGKTIPSLTNLLFMARFFNVTVDLLIDNGVAIRAPYSPICIFCGETHDIKQFEGKFICLCCIEKIKSRF